MARRAFYSFHYIPDGWRASQVRNMGVIEGNRPASDNDWETVKKGGDTAISGWIDDQMFGKSVTIVLIGTETAGRKWINYEILKTWNEGKGLLGVYIHRLKNQDGKQSSKGANPFSCLSLGNTPLSRIVKTYDPSGQTSGDTYACIKESLSDWIEEAIAVRDLYPKCG